MVQVSANYLRQLYAAKAKTALNVVKIDPKYGANAVHKIYLEDGSIVLFEFNSDYVWCVLNWRSDDDIADFMCIRSK